MRVLTCPDPDNWKRRLSTKIELSETGCWLWTAYRDRRGYGKFHAEGKSKSIGAHHAAWLAYRGDIPDPKLELDHLCRTPQCINPWHLELVTHAENLRRAALQPEEHGCTKHQRTDGYEWVTKRGHLRWVCRICAKASQARWRAKHTS